MPTEEDYEFMEYIDEMTGRYGYGLSLYKGDPVQFDIGKNEYFREKE